MKSVSDNDGRTVLFVSHNMAAVKSICQRGILLKSGTQQYDGDAISAVDFYMQGGSDLSSFREWTAADMPGNSNIKIRHAAVYGQGKPIGDPILTSDNIVFEVEFYNSLDNAVVDVTWDLTNVQGVHVAHLEAKLALAEVEVGGLGRGKARELQDAFVHGGQGHIDLARPAADMAHHADRHLDLLARRDLLGCRHLDLQRAQAGI